MTASCHQTSATGSAMQVASDTRQNGHKHLDCDAVPTREVRVSSFKRNHRISYDELMECESVWIDSREDQLPSSATDFFKSAAPSCEKSTAVGSSAEIDNLLIDVKDGRSARSETVAISPQFID
jgi:hypothetical protein